MSSSKSVRSPAKYCSSWMAACATARASPCGVPGSPNPSRVSLWSSPSSVREPTGLWNSVEKVMCLKRTRPSEREIGALPGREVAGAVVVRVDAAGPGPVGPHERVEQRQDQPEDANQHQDHADRLEVDP